MKIRTIAVVAALGLSVAGSAWARDYKVGMVEVDDLWVRATAPGQTNGAGYLEVENEATTPDRLISVSSPAAERVELHMVQTENGVAKMREVEGGIPLPPHVDVKLVPGGYHVMFLKLKSPFVEGTRIPATMKFEKAGEVAVEFKVKAAAHTPGMDHGTMKH